jgi:hypothetical protein
MKPTITELKQSIAILKAHSKSCTGCRESVKQAIAELEQELSERRNKVTQ